MNYSQKAIQKSSIEYLISGGSRSSLKDAALENLQIYTIDDFIFGKGVYESQLGKALGRNDTKGY